MVKKPLVFVLAAIFVMGTSAIALGDPPNNGPGCGLGPMVLGTSNQNAIGIQVLMATTNGTGMQTFGISSGTSGCTNDGTIVMKEKVNVFAAMNFDNISQEMAQGQGEHLTSLATLMGIPAENHQEFFSMTQAQYTSLVHAGETSPKAVVTAIYDAMGGHPVLALVSTTK